MNGASISQIDRYIIMDKPTTIITLPHHGILSKPSTKNLLKA